MGTIASRPPRRSGLSIVRLVTGRLRRPVGATAPRTDPVARSAAPVPTPVARRVLVIEDDAIVRLGLQAVLQDWGDEVILAASVDEALARLADGAPAPDVILADYRLRSGAVGTDAILKVRAAVARDVPGVLLTGDTGEEPLADAARHGFVVASKPIGSRELARVLRQATA